MPFLFFYHNKTNLSTNERSDQIKSSLSEILNLFYPLAGRIRNSGDVVLCNDMGVSFVEAKADFNMSQILENPNSNELNKLHPFEFHEVSDVLLTVQLTFFQCGGLALGIGLSHKLCDALSGLIFIKSWADLARGDTGIVTPSFDLAKMFPPCDIENLNMATGITKENIVTKRFVFLKSSVESLRERFSGNKEIQATRVEALSVFIWSRFMASTNQDDKTGKIYTMIHPVNLRRQADPVIPDNMFGNIMRFSVTIPKMTINEDDEAQPSLVEQMREEIRKIDAVYVKKLQEDSRGHLEFLNKQASGFVNGEIVSFSFTSLCKFPVYEADFGWGKPLWVASARMSYKNLVAFIDTKEGDSIEAWINLDQNDMSRFEADEELLQYVSSNPSVIASAS
ncbi:PREDICTED: vinorine synthase-like [Camelina sativa]|uniref:Vinorine synthase-like n=1 Tax=Camelina sativa TaxID=90675 RepID=A0ABM1QVY4_CAMSA|nr:PREDICTED: vinorine synthase-like [Camelina sativa]